jgi:hypothetical protein
MTEGTTGWIFAVTEGSAVRPVVTAVMEWSPDMGGKHMKPLRFSRRTAQPFHSTQQKTVRSPSAIRDGISPRSCSMGNSLSFPGGRRG